MTGVVGPEVNLEVNDLKLLSQEAADSTVDSGQGSFETLEPLSERDSDEEIFVSKKPKSRKVLQDSDSEAEDRDDAPEKPTYDDSAEDTKEDLHSGQSQSRSLLKALADSDEGNMGETPSQESPETQGAPSLEPGHQTGHSVGFTTNRKLSKTLHREGAEGKAKSKRRLEKEERTMEKIRRLKKKETRCEESDADRPLNDSGCLLEDSDLFETGLEEENDSALEDEVSLESIRAAVKNKLKNRKKKEPSLESEAFSLEDGNELSKGSARKERKAARLSKEALKKLHSETQRLVRESALNLPYHMPESKTIHDFFKRKPRPTCQGSAMALLKSCKYQSGHYKETIHPADAAGMGAEDSSRGSEQRTGAGIAAETNVLSEVSEEAGISAGSDEACGKDPVRRGELEIEETAKHSDDRPYSPGDRSMSQQEPSIPRIEDNEGHQAGDLTESDPPALEGEELKTVEKTDAKEGMPEQKTQSAAAGAAAAAAVVPPEKVRRFTVDRLRQLGVDVSSQPRLGADEDSFVILDEPKSNRELEALKQRFWRHANPAASRRACQTVNVNIIVKDLGTDGKEELKAEVVPVTLAAEKLEGASHTKPGEKLQMLKAKLQEAMKLRRLEERQKRQALFKLDNEDGFEEEEEEEEMTDESEEDGEEEVGEEEEEDQDIQEVWEII